jgi:hypothetical protein
MNESLKNLKELITTINHIKDNLLDKTSRIKKNLSMNQKLFSDLARLIDKGNILKEIKNPINYFDEEKK